MDTISRWVNEHEAEDPGGGGVGDFISNPLGTLEVSGRVNCGSGKDIVGTSG